MATPRKARPKPSTPTQKPSTTTAGREEQMVALAIDVAEQQMRAGDASAAVITHYLKLGTTQHKLEMAKLQNENDLLRARVSQIETTANSEEMYQKVIDAMTSYSPTQGDLHED